MDLNESTINKKPKTKKYIKVIIQDEVKHIPLRKDGRYRVSINKGPKDYKDDGTPIYDYDYLYGYDSLDLQKKITDYYNDVDNKEAEKTIFTTDIKSWLILNFWKIVKNTTYDRYEQVILNQIIPEAERLSHKKIKEITIDDCKTILKNIGEKKSASTYKKAYTLLKAYFDDKVEEGTIAKNPARFKRRGSKFECKDKEIEALEDKCPIYLNEDEIEKIKSIINNGYDIECKSRSGNSFLAHNSIPQGEFFIFMLNTGIRAGEAVALKYSDINFEKHLMTIRRNVTYSKKRDENGDVVKGFNRVESSPKTIKSADTVQINQTAIEILQKMLDAEPNGYKSYILHDKRKSSDEFEPQNRISPHALYMRWQNVCKYANLTPRGLHCLRHTFASQLFAITNGNAVLVSELLRHTDVSFTEKVYIDIIKKYRDNKFKEFKI